MSVTRREEEWRFRGLPPSLTHLGRVSIYALSLICQAQLWLAATDRDMTGLQPSQPSWAPGLSLSLSLILRLSLTVHCATVVEDIRDRIVQDLGLVRTPDLLHVSHILAQSGAWTTSGDISCLSLCLYGRRVPIVGTNSFCAWKLLIMP